MNIQLLSNICQTAGAPGFEDPIRKLIIDEIKDLVDSYEIDPMGNLIAYRKGRQDTRLMAAAHMDEISFIVTHVDDKGFVKFHPLGGFDPKTLTAQRVIIHGKKDIVGAMGCKPIHIMKPEERKKNPEIQDYFIDTGMSKEDLDKWVQVGDPITRERALVEMGDCISSKSLDNRISVYILIETLRHLKGKELPCDFYAVFTCQEEVGLRGATNAAHKINPQYAIAMDTTIAFDVPGSLAHEQVTRLGEGTAIKIMDGSVICDQRMVAFMKGLADKHGIRWQAEILPAGGTDTGALQRYGKDGSIAGAISIPTRHIHQVIEMVHKEDVMGAVDLMVACTLELENFDWNRP